MNTPRQTAPRLLLALLTLTLTAAATNTATTPVPRDAPKWLARNQAMADRIKQGNIDLLWIGDSIVQRWETDGKPTWDKYYAPRNAINLGISGDNTEHVLWRLDHYDLTKITPRLAIIMIGQNNGPHNTAEEIAEGVEAIVQLLRTQLPETKILVLGITLRGETASDEQTKLSKSNQILSETADNNHVFFLNINQAFLDNHGNVVKALMPDFEHPNAAGCAVWAAAIEPTVAQLLGDSPITPERTQFHTQE